MSSTPIVVENDEHRLIKERKRKLEEIREAGVSPYPYSYAVTHHAGALKQQYESLTPELLVASALCVI